MHKSLLSLALVAISLAGCRDKEAARELDALAPRLDAIRAKLKAVEGALPQAGQEKELACAAPINGVVFPLDEHVLRARNGSGEKTTTEDVDRSGSALEVPSDEQLRKSDTLGAQIQFLKKRLPLSEQVQKVLVLRATSADRGQLDGKKIVRAATWKGWAFLVGVAPGQLLAAWPVEAASNDSIEGIVREGHSRDLLTGNLQSKLTTAVKAQAQQRCGVEVRFQSESPF